VALGPTVLEDDDDSGMVGMGGNGTVGMGGNRIDGGGEGLSIAEYFEGLNHALTPPGLNEFGVDSLKVSMLSGRLAVGLLLLLS